jgi:hypothetical protein
MLTLEVELFEKMFLFSMLLDNALGDKGRLGLLGLSKFLILLSSVLWKSKFNDGLLRFTRESLSSKGFLNDIRVFELLKLSFSGLLVKLCPRICEILNEDSGVLSGVLDWISGVASGMLIRVPSFLSGFVLVFDEFS